MGKFIITEEEKNRILGMHKSRSAKNYLMEGTAPYSSLHGLYPIESIDVTNAPEDKKQALQNIKDVEVSGINEPGEDNTITFSIGAGGDAFLAKYSQGKITGDEWYGKYKGIVFNIPKLSDILSKILADPEGMMNK